MAPPPHLFRRFTLLCLVEDSVTKICQFIDFSHALTADPLVEPYAACVMCVFICKALCAQPNQAALLAYFSDHFNLADYMFASIGHVANWSSVDQSFVIGHTPVDLFAYILINLNGVLCSLPSDSFGLVEQAVMKCAVFSDATISRMLAMDVWCFLARYGHARLCYRQCDVLRKVIQNAAWVTRPRAGFAFRRLFPLLAENHQVHFLKANPLKTCAKMWRYLPGGLTEAVEAVAVVQIQQQCSREDVFTGANPAMLSAVLSYWSMRLSRSPAPSYLSPAHVLSLWCQLSIRRQKLADESADIITPCATVVRSLVSTYDTDQLNRLTFSLTIMPLICSHVSGILEIVVDVMRLPLHKIHQLCSLWCADVVRKILTQNSLAVRTLGFLEIRKLASRHELVKFVNVIKGDDSDLSTRIDEFCSGIVEKDSNWLQGCLAATRAIENTPRAKRAKLSDDWLTDCITPFELAVDEMLACRENLQLSYQSRTRLAAITSKMTKLIG